MRILVQRVTQARVTVDGVESGRIGAGLVALVGVRRGDGAGAAPRCADKCAHLRIFADGEGRMNRSVIDLGGQVLAVSQFTLYGDCRKGRRPSFVDAAEPALAETLYEAFIARLQEHGLRVERGVFGAAMAVEIHNDGPVTLIVEDEAP